MRVAFSLYGGYLKEDAYNVADFLIMIRGSLVTLESIPEEEFLDYFGKTKEDYFDMVSQKILREEIYGV